MVLKLFLVVVRGILYCPGDVLAIDESVTEEGIGAAR